MGHREIFTKSPRRRWRLPEQRTHYLDTGVLRRRSRTLRHSPLRHVAYTSALSLVELIAGARRSEKEFGTRRAAVDAVFVAGVAVDWQFPEAKVACAFPRLRDKYDIFETRCGSLQILVDAFRASRTSKEFGRRAEGLDLSEPLEFFESYDDEYAGDYTARAIEWARESKRLFDPNSFPAQLLGLPPTASHADYIRAFRASAFNGIIVRYGVARGVAENEGLTTEADHDELFMTYDGSIDDYLKVLSWRQFEHALGRVPGRNDAIDVAHLLYLVPGATFVTTDRALAECAMEVEIPCRGPDSVVAGAY